MGQAWNTKTPQDERKAMQGFMKAQPVPKPMHPKEKIMPKIPVEFARRGQ
jgi:hypothetical protein